MRPLSELISTDDSALPIIEELAAKVSGRCVVLPPRPDSGEILYRTQITTRSPMGAVVYHTGGIVVDRWIRIIGSGSSIIERNLPDWNSSRADGFYLIGDDVVGGFFAIDGGGLGFEKGHVCYWAPDSLDWISLERGYTDFLVWALTMDTMDFYADLRWSSWEAEVSSVPGDRCFGFYPFLWTAEGSTFKSKRAIVPAQEAFDMKIDVCRQLSEL